MSIVSTPFCYVDDSLNDAIKLGINGINPGHRHLNKFIINFLKK